MARTGADWGAVYCGYTAYHVHVYGMCDLQSLEQDMVGRTR
jgi:hypothetical protein